MCVCVCVCVCVWNRQSLFIHSFNQLWHLGCFHLLAIVSNNDNIVNKDQADSSSKQWFDLFGYTHKSGLLDHMVVLLQLFWENSILFSTKSKPIYIPTNKEQRCPISCIFVRICYLLFFCNGHSTTWVDISLWFWFAFLDD